MLEIISEGAQIETLGPTDKPDGQTGGFERSSALADLFGLSSNARESG